jgi:FMN phosphatase YigB (HAD superfamily)
LLDGTLSRARRAAPTEAPDPAFFREVISAAPCDAGQIVYVGDRLDNDLRPAKAAGIRTAFIRRGPWGYIQERHPDLPGVADWRMTTLAELPPIVAAANAVIALTVVLQS